VIGRELHNPAIVPENVYNMDETGIPEDGRTPLLWAAEGGHEAVVKLLRSK
jgi:ankyrin repeat protein